MNKKDVFALLMRYALLILIGLFGMSAIYAILTPVTAYPSFLLLKLFYAVHLEGNTLVFANASINLVSACIAGAAYYLLLMLNLATPMPLKLRLKSLGFSFISLFILNLFRIIIFAALFIKGFSYFDVMHKFFWYFGSTVLVVAVWFLTVRMFRIKAIPACTDLKNLFDNLSSKRRDKK